LKQSVDFSFIGIHTDCAQIVLES